MSQRPSPRSLWRPIAAFAATALTAGAIVAAPVAAQAAEVEVSGITFDWGVNNESNGGAYFGGCNFLSAGVAGNAGASRLWSESDGFYKASEGNTTIVKPTADGEGLQSPTWATKCLLPDGSRLVQPTSSNPSSYTQSRVQIAEGSGTVDVAANTAEIQWDGSFTIAYYGGMTYWSVTDPKLVVDSDGTGTVTALVTGYGADMDDPSIWQELPDHPDLTLATLTDVDVTEDGITVTPDYLGVTVPDEISGRNPYISDQAWSGAFPADFLEFQQLTGQSSYWYTTAGGENSIQPRKATLPLNVSYELPATLAPVITTQPETRSATLGEDAVFSVTADNATQYQWQSAPTDADTWSDIAGATSADLSVPATTANAVRYRVTVSGDGGSVTSDAASLTVDVPEPTVTISKSEGLDPAGESVTVSGSGFLPNSPLTSGTRPPLAGKFTGAYIALASSVDGVLTNHTNSLSDYTTWAVHAEDGAAIGGGGAVIEPDGTFSVQIRAEKFDLADGGVWGIRTYAAGGSTYAPFSTFTPVSFAVLAPEAPAAPTAVLGDDGTSVVVTWTAPNDNGEAINGYDVTLTPTSGDAIALTVPADRLTATFSGLVPGTTFSATVIAKNAGGASPASPASDPVEIPVPAATAPSAPEAPTATAAGTSSINVSWAAPASDGGSPVTGYVVTVRQGDEIVSTTTATGTTATVDGLQAATAYTITVAAVNDIGTSPESVAVSVSTLEAAPAALEAPTVTAASGTSINVSWTPAENVGTITGYIVTVLHGSDIEKRVEVGADVTTTVIDDLASGVEYTATVAAVNGAGAGEPSPASEPVTTFASPATPAVTAERVGADSVSASWSVPADGGSAITGYTASLLRDGNVVQTQSLAAAVVQTEFTSVAAGTYTVSVVATNAVGSSPAGASDEVTIPATAPAAPATPVLALGADGESATVGWTAPLFDGGSAITGYTVTLQGAGSEALVAQVGADARSHVFTRLPSGTYTATVTATNAAGSTVSESSADLQVPGEKPSDEPELLTDDDTTEQSFGDADIIVDGRAVRIDVGTGYANEWIGVSVNSTPVFLGWFLTDGLGVVTLTLPADLAAGVHHLVVYSADGEVLGYQAFTVATADGGGSGDPSTVTGAGNLATTGSDGALIWSVAGFGLLLLIAGSVVMVARRRAAHVDR